MTDRDVPTPAAPAPASLGPVCISLRSSRGPFAFGRTRRLPPQRVPLLGIADGVATATVDPLQTAGRGLALAGAALSVTLEAGQPPTLVLAGTVPARPGSYTTTLRVAAGSGAPLAVPTLAVPVRIDVAASPAWGIGLTLLGLSVVSLMAGLDEAATVAAKRRDVLLRRSAAVLFVEQHEIPTDRAEVVAMDRDYETAITALSRSRSAGLLDHRIEDAAAPLAEADALAAGLRQAAAGQSPADALVAAAVTPWQAFEPQLKALDTPMPSPGTTPPARLEAVLARLHERFVAAPARWFDNELTAQVAQLRLIAAAGDRGEARAQAQAVQISIRRAASSLARGERFVMREGSQLGYMLGTVAEIEQAIADPALPDAAHAELSARLQAAWATLPEGADFARIVGFNRALNAAASALTEAEIQAVQARIDKAAQDASAETEMPGVEAAMAAAQADPDRSPANKTAHFHEIVAAWHTLIAGARDPAARPALLARLDAVSAAVDRGDMQAVGSAYGALAQAWADYGKQRITAAATAALLPYCDHYAAQLQRRLGAVDQQLRWEDAKPRITEWDRRRDRLRLALNRVAPDNQCLGALLALDKEESGLTGEIGAAAADTSGIAATVRAEALAVYGAPPAPATRVLTPRTDPPTADRTVDRPLTFAVDGLDHDWGAGTALLIDFGDGTPAWRGDVESLQSRPPVHAYARPLTAHLSARAADALAADGAAIGPALGEGTATLLIEPAPDGRARAVADRFLSLRFALALLIALVIYSWRFLARDRVFGARGFDYAEAFALGFAVNAAIAELPAALAKLPLG